MGFLKEMYEDVTGKSNRPEIKGDRIESFISFDNRAISGLLILLKKGK